MRSTRVLLLLLFTAVVHGQEPLLEVPSVRILDGNEIASWHQSTGDVFRAVVIVRAGARDEPDSERGIAHFVEHLVFAKTSTISRQLRESRIDHLGARFDGLTGHDHTAFWIESRAGIWSEVLGWLIDGIARPAFDATDIRRERGRIEHELLARTHPHLRALPFGREYFGSHAFGEGTGGEAAALVTIDSTALRRFWLRHYVGSGIIIATQGPMTHDEVVTRLERVTAVIPPGETPPERTPPQGRSGRIKVAGASPAAAQYNVRIGYHISNPGPEDWATTRLIREVMHREFVRRLEDGGIAYAPDVVVEEFTDALIILGRATIRQAEHESEVLTAFKLAAAEALALTEEEFNLAREEAVENVGYSDILGFARWVELVARLSPDTSRPIFPEAELASLDRRRVADRAPALLASGRRFVISTVPPTSTTSHAVLGWVLVAVLAALFAIEWATDFFVTTAVLTFFGRLGTTLRSRREDGARKRRMRTNMRRLEEEIYEFYERGERDDR